jgi:hypothetical protein
VPRLGGAACAAPDKLHHCLTLHLRVARLGYGVRVTSLLWLSSQHRKAELAIRRWAGLLVSSVSTHPLPAPFSQITHPFHRGRGEFIYSFDVGAVLFTRLLQHFLERAIESGGLSEHPRMDFYFYTGDFLGGNIQ